MLSQSMPFTMNFALHSASATSSAVRPQNAAGSTRSGTSTSCRRRRVRNGA